LANSSYFGATPETGTATAVDLGNYFGAAEAGLFSIEEGTTEDDNHLAFGLITPTAVQEWRTISVLIDASTFNVGDYDYDFEVENFVAGAGSPISRFSIFEITGLDTTSERVGFLNAAAGGPPSVRPYNSASSSGTFTIGKLDLGAGEDHLITGNGTMAGTFNIGTSARAETTIC
jgi:hypothetical protein